MGRRFALLFAAVTASCAPSVEDASSASRRQETSSEAIRPARPSRGLVLELPPEHALASHAIESFVGRSPRGLVAYADAGPPPLPVFLNRYGGSYSPGDEDSIANTSIIPIYPSTVSPYGGTDAEWSEVVRCVSSMFSRFNVRVIDSEPASGEYIETVIGGTPAEVGQENGVSGVAPIDPTRCRIIPTAIVYVFSEVLANRPQATCETAAQEIAHALSLDHEFYCPDPMTYLGGCGNKEFRDHDAACGEYRTRACNCGRPSQNSVEILTYKVGLAVPSERPPPTDDSAPPTVVIQSPQDGDRVEANSTLTVSVAVHDEGGVASTELLWGFSSATYPCPYDGDGGAVVCERVGDVSTWKLSVAQGDRTFSVRARDLAGNVNETPPRTVHVGSAIPPVADSTPPTAEILSPADGATLPANASLTVTASAADDAGLAAVELLWAGGQDAYPCPFSGQNVSCSVHGGQYTWALRVGSGTRKLSVRATDLAGNRFETPSRTIVLATGLAPPPDAASDTVAEDNDSAADAFPSRCGVAVDLVVRTGDDDWFSFDAPEGVAVKVGVAARASAVIGVELYDATGQSQLAGAPDVLASGGAVEATSLGPKVLARISTNEQAIGYRLSTICAEPPSAPQPGPQDPDQGSAASDDPSAPLRGHFGCTCTRGGAPAPPPALLVLALALFARARRRGRP